MGVRLLCLLYLLLVAVRKTEISALLDRRIQTRRLTKCCVHKKVAILVCFIVGLVRIGQGFSLSNKIMCRRVTKNCCFVSDILFTVKVSLLYSALLHVSVYTTVFSVRNFKPS